MKNSNEKILFTLIQRGIAISIGNNVALKELEKIDCKVSKRIRRKFAPKTPPKFQYSKTEYFNSVIKNLARQIFITEEIHNEIQKINTNPNTNFKVIIKNLGNIDAIKERKK